MYIEKTLTNGVRVAMEKLPEMRSVTLGIWVKAGSVCENAETNGISHFIEHMLFKGTEKRSYLDIASEIDNVGGQLNAFTGKECTCYYAKVIDEQQITAVDVLTDMLCNSVFENKELEKERGVVIEEINMSNDTPDDIAGEKISEQFFRGTELSKTILGPAENIRRFTEQDIRSYMDRFYTAENTVVAAVGNIDEDALIDALEEKLVGLSRHREPEKMTVPQGWAPQPSFLYIPKDTEQTHLCIALKGYSYLDPRKYTLSLISNLLGGSMSSRLFQTIREELGMAYSVYSYSSMYTGAGSLMVYAGTSPENAARVTEEILHILGNFKMTAEELKHNKAQLKGNFILSQESMSAKMNGIGKNILLRGHFLTESDILKALDAVTLEDVNAAIEELFDMNCLSGVCVGQLKDENALKQRFL